MKKVYTTIMVLVLVFSLIGCGKITQPVDIKPVITESTSSISPTVSPKQSETPKPTPSEENTLFSTKLSASWPAKYAEIPLLNDFGIVTITNDTTATFITKEYNSLLMGEYVELLTENGFTPANQGNYTFVKALPELTYIVSWTLLDGTEGNMTFTLIAQPVIPEDNSLLSGWPEALNGVPNIDGYKVSAVSYRSSDDMTVVEYIGVTKEALDLYRIKLARNGFVNFQYGTGDEAYTYSGPKDTRFISFVIVDEVKGNINLVGKTYVPPEKKDK